MNMELLEELYKNNKLGMLYPSFSWKKRFYKPLKAIIPLILYPHGEKLEPSQIISVVVFGSCIYPKIIFQKGRKEYLLWGERNKIPVIEDPNDIDVAVITKGYESEYYKEAILTAIYGGGYFLESAGVHLTHISKETLQRNIEEKDSVALSINNGVTIVGELSIPQYVIWDWDNDGRVDCLIEKHLETWYKKLVNKTQDYS